MLPWLTIAAVIVGCDQLTKLWIVKLLQGGQFINLTSFLNIVLAYNKGAAFSLLASASGWQRYFFTGVSIVAVLFILHFMRKNAGQKLFCWAFALILGGAIGNLIDRVLYGQVTDFIDFHLGTWHWPAFNVADSAITIGAILFVIDELRRVNRSR
jgi:signal peptidase II